MYPKRQKDRPSQIRRPRFNRKVLIALDDMVSIAEDILQKSAGDKSQAAIDYWFDYEEHIARARRYVDDIGRWLDIKEYGPRAPEKVKVGGKYKALRGVK